MSEQARNGTKHNEARNHRAQPEAAKRQQVGPETQCIRAQGAQYEPEIMDLLQKMHVQQLQQFEAHYAQLEVRIMKAVKMSIGMMQPWPGGKCVPAGVPSKDNDHISYTEPPDEIGSSPQGPDRMPWQVHNDESNASQFLKQEELVPEMQHEAESIQSDASGGGGGGGDFTRRTKSGFESLPEQVGKHLHQVTPIARRQTNILDGEEVGSVQKWVGTLLQSHMLETVVLFVILSNTVYMAWETDWIAQTLHEPELDMWWVRGLELFFTIFFTLDLALRVFAERETFIFGKNFRWNMLDAIVVFAALCEEALRLTSLPQSTALSSTKAIRVIRVLRLIRVVRFIKGASFLGELRAICLGILQSIGSLFWAVFLLVVIIFLFSIYLTQGVAFHRMEEARTGESDSSGSDEFDSDLQDKFGSLLQTMYSLWKAISGGADWGDFGDVLFQVSALQGSIFVFYVAFAICAMLNVVTGVFVNKALKVAESDIDLVLLANNEDRKDLLDNVRRVFEKADLDGSGCLSRQEFSDHFGNPCVQAFFSGLELDLDGIHPDQLFNLLDFDGDSRISSNEFIYGCSTMKGYARNLDVARLSFNMNKHNKHMMKLCKRTTDAVHHLSKALCVTQKQQASESERMLKCCEELASTPATSHLPHQMCEVSTQNENGLEAPGGSPHHGRAIWQDVAKFEVFFGEHVLSLGFEVQWRMPTPMVGLVEVGGEGAKHGVRTGDCIDVINEVRSEGFCRDDLLPLLKRRPLTLGFSRTNYPSTSFEREEM